MSLLFLAWVVLTRLFIVCITAMGVYESMKSNNGKLKYRDESMISWCITSLFCLELILFFAAFILVGVGISKAVKWGLYGLGMLLTQTFNIVTSKEEE